MILINQKKDRELFKRKKPEPKESDPEIAALLKEEEEYQFFLTRKNK